MRFSGFIAALCVLAACQPAPVQPTGPDVIAYRNPTVPLGSAALFEPSDLVGHWHVMTEFPDVASGFCYFEAIEFFAEGQGQLYCVSGETHPLTYHETGPGRFTLTNGGPITQDFWVLWMDWDARTLVFGAPDGLSGGILDKNTRIPADRLNAAREILDFNGYDLSRLTEVTR